MLEANAYEVMMIGDKIAHQEAMIAAESNLVAKLNKHIDESRHRRDLAQARIEFLKSKAISCCSSLPFNEQEEAKKASVIRSFSHNHTIDWKDVVC